MSSGEARGWECVRLSRANVSENVCPKACWNRCITVLSISSKKNPEEILSPHVNTPPSPFGMKDDDDEYKDVAYSLSGRAPCPWVLYHNTPTHTNLNTRGSLPHAVWPTRKQWWWERAFSSSPIKNTERERQNQKQSLGSGDFCHFK